MKKVLVVLLGVSFLSLICWQAVQAQNVNEEKQAVAEATKPQNVGNKICPVSGEEIAHGKMKPAAYEYEGKIYNFCCAGCIDEFKKDPQRYIKKVDEELKTNK